MKKTTGLLFMVLFFFSSCSIIVTWFKPGGFTQRYDGKYTGIDTLLNIDGYFYSDSTQYTVLFYRDGTIANYSAPQEDKYFDKDTKNKYVYIPRWGVYRLYGDTVKAQTILNFGGMKSMGTGIDTYVIKSKTEIELYSTNKDYTSRKEDIVKVPLYYHPYSNRLDSTHYWVEKRRWFWDKKAYKERKKK